MKTKKTVLKARKSAVVDHLHDPGHLHHLYMALAITVFEIGIILGVTALVVHLIVAVGLFGRDACDILMGD